jgi:hypothetical protein
MVGYADIGGRRLSTLSPCGRGRDPALSLSKGREGEGAVRHGAGSPLTLPLLRNGGNPFDRSAIEPSGAGRKAPGRVAPLPQGERGRKGRG